MTTNGSTLLAQALKQQGVDTMFFLMGGPMLAAESACIEQGIRSIDVRHEQAAAMMAHAYARVRNTPGVCLAASGPGTLNLGTGLATSLVDCTPVVALGGSSSLSEVGTGAFQEFDQVAAMRPLVKWADRVHEARRVPELIDKAFTIAMSGKPGPVYLDFPGDLLYRALDPASVVWPKRGGPPVRPQPGADPQAIEDVARLLETAQRPVLVTGSGVIWSAGSEAMRAFVDATGIPFYTTPQGRGVVPEDHESCYLQARTHAFREADLVLVVGTRVNYVLSHLQPPRFNAHAKIVRIDVDPVEVASTPRLQVGLVADARLAFDQLRQACQGRVLPLRFADWRRHLAEVHARRAMAQEALLNSPRRPIHPLRLCREIRDFIDRDAILVVDGQEILNFGRQSIPSFVPGHRINSGTFGTMGVGLPYALGAKAARPERQVICLHGDGSLGMNFMELDTAVRHGLPVITVVSLNGGWTSDPSRTKPGRELGLTRYHDMAAALGCHAAYVDDPQQIRPALERARQAVNEGIPALINVCTDPDAQATTAKFTTFYDAA
jgi:thiamine pyrophosphate-dependent acetolactate synthase large subunit-like protein